MVKKNKPRYELKQKLGEGGMAVVWQAYDTVLNADVALKMLLDVHDATALKLFSEECKRQASLIHPNVIEIRDVGSFEENGIRQPYLVMPLLRGKTLADLVLKPRQALSVERCIDIFTQTCRGLQAAHDHGLIHRDIKPTNIFILDDDSVKIIDFGVAQRMELARTGGRKGTLLYMSPEQLLVKPLSRASDIFSLGVVCYEVLTGEHPFAEASEGEIAEAIQHHTPPAASTLNGEVSTALSQVLHKAMAKLPVSRYTTAKEFGDALRRAFYDPTFCVFDPANFEPRLSKASEAFLKGDLNFAQEIINELQAEGYLDAGLQSLASDVKSAVQRRDVDQLLDTAKARIQGGEYRLALQRIQKAIELDDCRPEALALQLEVKAQQDEVEIREWLEVARQHLSKFSFAHAKQAAACILENHPEEERARQLLSQIERKKDEYEELREQKAQAYAAALEAKRQNDLMSALGKMKQVIELDKQAPDLHDSGKSAELQNLYNKFRAEHESIEERYREAKGAFESGEHDVVARICDDLLETYPQHTLFQALKCDNDQRRRRAAASMILELEERAENEPDLDCRVSIFEEAVGKNPDVIELRDLLQAARRKRELVSGLVERARELAENSEFDEAIVQWETLKTIHPQYLEIDSAIDSLRQQRIQSEQAVLKSRWLDQIQSEREEGRLEQAFRSVQLALADFPQDDKLIEVEKDIQAQRRIAAETERLIEESRSSLQVGNLTEGMEKSREAYRISSNSPGAKVALIEGLLAAAKISQDDPEQALNYLQEIVKLDPRNQAALDMLRFLERRTGHEDPDHLSKHEKAKDDGEFNQDPGSSRQSVQTGPGSAETSISSETEFDATVSVQQLGPTLSHGRRGLRLAWLFTVILVAGSASLLYTFLTKREHSISQSRSRSENPPAPAPHKEPPAPVLTPAILPLPAALPNLSKPAQELQVVGVGSLNIDGSHFFPVRDVAFSLTLSDGEHHLQWIDRSGKTEGFSFTVQQDQPATIRRQPSAAKNNSQVMVVSTSGNIAAVCSTLPAKLQVDGEAKDRATSQCAQLNLKNGYHEFRVSSPVESRVASVEIGSGRILAFIFGSESGYGTLTIDSKQADFDVTLFHAGKEYRRARVAGNVAALDHLPPGQYSIHAQKNGFQPPPDIPVTIGKLQKARVTLDLAPLTALLVHSLPETDVALDGNLVGTTDKDGNLTLNNLTCARHIVEARRNGRTATQEVQLVGNKSLNQVDVPVKPGPGTVLLTLSPSSAAVGISQADGKILSVSGSKFELPGGEYRITVSAPHFEERTQTVHIIPDYVNKFDFSLVEQRPAVQPAPTPAAGFEGWNKDEWDFNKKNSVMSHKKSGIALLDSQHNQGSYVFTIAKEKFPILGRKASQWVAGYQNPDNYLLFSINHANFETYLMHGGQIVKHGSSLQLPEMDQYTIAMIVQPKQIEVFIYQNGTWVRLEQWNDIQEDLDQGRFGFKDRLVVRNFRFNSTIPVLTAKMSH